ncbi:Hint domain-containing protein [Acidisoma cladoniae]|uniref:Hint domain-containing protein n=1 Tax=Acidisoma cladoniae TaxID=3040935 RepID=UPI00254E0B30|nr:Hint domain-containing protein [Acidisoma sp. PAMC 29798]
MSTEVFVAATQAELQSDIDSADQGAPAGTSIEIDLGADITLNHDLDAIDLEAGESLTINGEGHVLDGAGMYRGIFAYAGTTTIENLGLNDMRAQGGAGGLGGGGAGAGLGGGLFVASGANVTLDGVSFKDDQAVGGQGGATTTFTDNGVTYGGTGGGGGGGLGGSGGPAEATAGTYANNFMGKTFAGAGGGVGVSAFGGSYNTAPGAGLIVGAGPAGAGTAGTGSSAGGANGGGGGGAGAYSPPNLRGGYGFGGGGGVGGTAGGNEQYVSGTGASGFRPAAGNGGFGGGGGGGGGGGFGGGGGGDAGGVAGSGMGSGAGWGAGNGDAGYGISTGTAGGFGGGGGAQFGYGPDGNAARINYGGGGGLGAGGGIFVQQGGKLTIGAGSFSGGSVTGGQGAEGAGSGQAFGSGIFGEGNDTINLAPAAGQTLTIGDAIADQEGSDNASSEETGGNGNPADNAYGAVSLNVDGTGTVSIAAAANTFTGGITLTSGTLDLAASGAAGSGKIAFATPGGAVLEFATSVAPTNTITGFTHGDTLQVDDLDLTGHSYDGTTLTLDGAGGPVSVIIPGVQETFTFSEVSGADDVIVGVAPCFGHGTHIATKRGQIRVEDLRVGDKVLTLDDSQPVIWIGHREVRCDRHPAPHKVNPVRISAGAFGNGLPTDDLFLSPDHAIFAEAVLIPIKHLINGSTIRQVEVVTAHYYHVELPAHAVVLAEGLPAESYLDTGDRNAFFGSRSTDLYPAWGSEAQDIALVMDALGYAPLRVAGPEIERLRKHLAARAFLAQDRASA